MRTPGVRMAISITLLIALVVGLQIALERAAPAVAASTDNVLYVQSPEVLARAALSYDALAADLYWLRTVQHYGRTKLSTDLAKKYDLLHPLLDLTTSLDPYFNVAYRFGAIFLAEPFPSGPGRPDQAIALLEKGLRTQPAKWEFAQDIGFINYWWLHQYDEAARWFERASKLPDAPAWLAAIAAVTLAQGGNRDSSRQLWQELARNAEADWLKRAAEQRLLQLDAMDHIDQLQGALAEYQRRAGRPAGDWRDLIAARMLGGFPVDPLGLPYQLQSGTGKVTLSPESSLNPLPLEPIRR